MDATLLPLLYSAPLFINFCISVAVPTPPSTIYTFIISINTYLLFYTDRGIVGEQIDVYGTIAVLKGTIHNLKEEFRVESSRDLKNY